jgi:hypothetical protein
MAERSLETLSREVQYGRSHFLTLRRGTQLEPPQWLLSIAPNTENDG